jgi:hypothetical protein
MCDNSRRWFDASLDTLFFLAHCTCIFYRSLLFHCVGCVALYDDCTYLSCERLEREKSVHVNRKIMCALGSYVNALWSQTNNDYYAEPIKCQSQSSMLGTKHAFAPIRVLKSALTCNASVMKSHSVS